MYFCILHFIVFLCVLWSIKLDVDGKNLLLFTARQSGHISGGSGGEFALFLKVPSLLFYCIAYSMLWIPTFLS